MYKVGDRVTIITCGTKRYEQYHLNRREGYIMHVRNNIAFAVRIDEMYNPNSRDGCFWFMYSELDKIKKVEDIKMTKKYYRVKNNVHDRVYYVEQLEENLPIGTSIVYAYKNNYYVGEISSECEGNVSDACIMVCVVDFTKYHEMIRKKKIRDDLRHKMRARFDEISEDLMFEIASTMDEEMFKLYKEYKENA